MTADRRAARLVLARRKRLIQAIARELHPRQRAVVRDASRYIALLCGRRAGKTELVARLIAIAIISSGDNEWVVFGARTQAIAKDLIWAHLVRINDEYGLGWKMSEHTGSLRAQNGARFRVFGVDDRVAIDKVRGYKIRLACFDEASTYDDLIPGLIQSLSPALTDLSGRLVLEWRPEQAWSAAVEVQAFSSTPASDRNGDRVPGHALVNARLVHRLQPSMALTARIDNLFDRDYSSALIVNEGQRRYYEPGPGRRWWLGIEYGF